MEYKENEIITINVNIPKTFANAVKEYHESFNIELIDFKKSQTHKGWITLIVKGGYKDMKLLNAKCEETSCKIKITY